MIEHLRWSAMAALLAVMLSACGSSGNDVDEALTPRSTTTTSTTPATATSASTSTITPTTTAAATDGPAYILAVLESERASDLTTTLAAIGDAITPSQVIEVSEDVGRAYRIHHDAVVTLTPAADQQEYHEASVANLDDFAAWFTDFAEAVRTDDRADQQRLNGLLFTLTEDELDVARLRTDAILTVLAPGQDALSRYLLESMVIIRDHLGVLRARLDEFTVALARSDSDRAVAALEAVSARVEVSSSELDALVPPVEAERLHRARQDSMAAADTAFDELFAAMSAEDLVALQDAVASALGIGLQSNVEVVEAENDLLMLALGG